MCVILGQAHVGGKVPLPLHSSTGYVYVQLLSHSEGKVTLGEEILFLSLALATNI